MKLDVLAIGAHPDDIDLSCGGTVIKLGRQGYSVGLIDLTEGELGTRGSREIRLQEAEKARIILGASVRENLRLPDGNIDNTPENRLQLIRVIRRYRPEILLIPHDTDRHPDHEHAHVLPARPGSIPGCRRFRRKMEATPRSPGAPVPTTTSCSGLSSFRVLSWMSPRNMIGGWKP